VRLRLGDDVVFFASRLESAFARHDEFGHGPTIAPVTYDFSVEGPVQTEIFVLWLDGERVMLSGPCGADPWLIEVDDGADPVDTVSRLVRDNIGDAQIVHSTSWRTARNGVVLSFVVVITPELARPFASVPVDRAELARSEATSAPDAIAWAQVVEHGLRHLAWLVTDDPVVRTELGGAWAHALAGYTPEPFRNLRQRGS
jgi:hypothetical protein